MLDSLLAEYGPRHDKTNEMSERQAKTQISLASTQPFSIGGGGTICPGSSPAGGYHM